MKSNVIKDRSVSEKLIGKPLQEWTIKELFLIRLIAAALGANMWFFFLIGLKMAKQTYLFPFSFIMTTTILYFIGLAVAACFVIKTPSHLKGTITKKFHLSNLNSGNPL